MPVNSEGRGKKAVVRLPLLKPRRAGTALQQGGSPGEAGAACSGPLPFLLIQVRQAGFLCVAVWALWAGSGGNLSASCSWLSSHICEAASFHCH